MYEACYVKESNRPEKEEGPSDPTSKTAHILFQNKHCTSQRVKIKANCRQGIVVKGMERKIFVTTKYNIYWCIIIL